MGIVHFLNVKDGDCSIIQHLSGNVTMIDVCNASGDDLSAYLVEQQRLAAEAAAGSGNFNQKDYPVDPILYMRERSINDIFRYIQSHPEMDHMDGIAATWLGMPSRIMFCRSRPSSPQARLVIRAASMPIHGGAVGTRT